MRTLFHITAIQPSHPGREHWHITPVSSVGPILISSAVPVMSLTAKKLTWGPILHRVVLSPGSLPAGIFSQSLLGFRDIDMTAWNFTYESFSGTSFLLCLIFPYDLMQVVHIRQGGHRVIRQTGGLGTCHYCHQWCMVVICPITLIVTLITYRFCQRKAILFPL